MLATGIHIASGAAAVQRGRMELSPEDAAELDKPETAIVRRVGGAWVETSETFAVVRPAARTNVKAYTQHIADTREILAGWLRAVNQLDKTGDADPQLIEDYRWVIDDLDKKLSKGTTSEIIGILDEHGVYHAFALYDEVKAKGDKAGYIEIDDLVSNPARFDPAGSTGVKGAALAATRELIEVSTKLGYSGRIQLKPLESSKWTYMEWGFRDV